MTIYSPLEIKMGYHNDHNHIVGERFKQAMERENYITYDIDRLAMARGEPAMTGRLLDSRFIQDFSHRAIAGTACRFGYHSKDRKPIYLLAALVLLPQQPWLVWSSRTMSQDPTKPVGYFLTGPEMTLLFDDSDY